MWEAAEEHQHDAGLMGGGVALRLTSFTKRNNASGGNNSEHELSSEYSGNEFQQETPDIFSRSDDVNHCRRDHDAIRLRRG